jgi:hypothetical protein
MTISPQVGLILEAMYQCLKTIIYVCLDDRDVTIEARPVAYELKVAAKAMGIGMTKLTQLRTSGQIKTVKIGGRPKITAAELDRYLRRLEKRK